MTGVRARLDEALAENLLRASELSRLRADRELASVPEAVGEASEVGSSTSNLKSRCARLSDNYQDEPLLTGDADVDSSANACRTTPAAQEDQDFAALARKCSQLPPPRPGESTIVCEEAYAIIKQQNIHGLSLDAIGEYLKPGFRGPTCHGGGCRVDSTRVFSAIDSISSSVPLVSSTNRSS